MRAAPLITAVAVAVTGCESEVSQLEAACDGGSPEACYRLGMRYDAGDGVSQDFTRGAALFQKACDAGDAMGCYNLGVSYDIGEGVPEDDSARRPSTSWPAMEGPWRAVTTSLSATRTARVFPRMTTALRPFSKRPVTGV